jgi:hypothetical protein
MSVSGISSTNLFDFNSQSVQSRRQQFEQEFQQLGQDLQSGNLSATQLDFASLQQLGPQSNSTSSAQSNAPAGQEFNQLSKDLQAGNVPAAQQDFAKIQQDFQNHATQGHHHHHGGDGSGASGISQLLEQLGQDLQSGSLSSAQQAYNSLQQDFQRFAQNSGALTPTAAQSSPSALSVSV